MDFESQKSDIKSMENIVPTLSSTISIEDVKIESNGSIGHNDDDDNDDDGDDLKTNGNGSSEAHLDPEKPKEEAEDLNSNDHENLESCPGNGYGSLHSNRSTSGYYLDAVTLVRSREKGSDNDLDGVDSCVSSPTAPPISGEKGKGLRKWKRITRKFVKDGSLSKDSAKILKRSADLVVGIAEMKQKSDSTSESSVNVLNTHLPDGSTFSAATGSDEDRNSRSSTAACIPKSRLDIPRTSGRSRDKQKPKPMSGKYFQAQLQQGLANVNATKKPRGGAISMDKENSLSTPDSDSASYSSSGINNNGRSDKGAGYAADDGPTGEKPSFEQLPTRPSLCFEDEEISQELQKFEELGKDLRSFGDDSIRTTGADPEFCAASSSDGAACKEFGTEIIDAMTAKLILLAKKTEILEKQVEQAQGKLKEKETKIAELEETINNLKSSNKDLGRSIDVQQTKLEEIEAEVDALFKQKMEAEIQYLAIADTSVVAENRMKLLLKEQKFLVSVQAQEMQKVDKLKRKAANLEAKVEVWLASGRGTAGAEKMQKKICKFTLCFCIQLIFFFFVLELFISQFLPKKTVVLPT